MMKDAREKKKKNNNLITFQDGCKVTRYKCCSTHMNSK